MPPIYSRPVSGANLSARPEGIYLAGTWRLLSFDELLAYTKADRLSEVEFVEPQSPSE